jgi:hypothetical protein
MGSERESDCLMASAAARCAQCDIAMRRWESKIREVGNERRQGQHDACFSYIRGYDRGSYVVRCELRAVQI